MRIVPYRLTFGQLVSSWWCYHKTLEELNPGERNESLGAGLNVL